jgi:hypothetical protein
LPRSPSNRVCALVGSADASPLGVSAACGRLARHTVYRPGDRVAEGEIRHRLALDIGGTFTDLAAVNVATGELSSKDRRVA